MGRPHVINEPRRTYNLLFSVSDYEKLRKISHELSKANGFHVSIAHLIREGAKSVIAFYEEEKSDPKVSRATEWLTCAGCGERFQARDNDWVALATGAFVHHGGRWGKSCHDAYSAEYRKQSEAGAPRGVHAAAQAEEKRRLKAQRAYEKAKRSSSKECGDDPLEQAGKEAYGYVDMVNSPSHYNQSGIECIDAIEAMTGDGLSTTSKRQP